MQYNRINCFSKMIVFIATLFIVQLCSNNICYATSPITFSEYIKTDDFKTKVMQEISERLSKTSYTFSKKSDTYCISSPYSLPYYNIPTDKFVITDDIKCKAKFSKVYNNNKLVGIIRYMNLSNIDNIGIEYFILPDWLGDCYQDIPLFCADWLVDSDGKECISYSDNNFICGSVNNKSYLLFNGYDKFYGVDLSSDFYSILHIKSEPIYVAAMDTVSCDDLLFEIEIEHTNNVTTAEYYVIKNKYGKALTYLNGTYTLSDFTDSKNQFFKISDNQDGTYSITPYLTNRKMAVKGNTTFFISSAYLNENIYQIVDTQSHKFLKSNKSYTKPIFGEYIFDFSTIWYIE